MYNQKPFSTLRGSAWLCVTALFFCSVLNKTLAQTPTCNGWNVSLNTATDIGCFSQTVPIRLSNADVPSGGSVVVQKLHIVGELVVPNTLASAEADISPSSGGLGGSFSGSLSISSNSTNGRKTNFEIDFDNSNNPVTLNYPSILASLKITAPANVLYQIKVSTFEILTTVSPVLCQKSNLLTAAISQPPPNSAATDVRIFVDGANATSMGSNGLSIPIKIKQTIGTSGGNPFSNIAFKLKPTDEFKNLTMLPPSSSKLPEFDLSLNNQGYIMGKTITPFGIQGINATNGVTLGFIKVEVKDGLPLQAGNICLEFEWIIIEETLTAGPNSNQTACSSALPSNNNVCKKVGSSNLPCASNGTITLSVPEPEQVGCNLTYRVKLVSTNNETVRPRRIKIKATFDNPDAMTVNASSFKCSLISPPPLQCTAVVSGNTVEYTYVNNSINSLGAFSSTDNIGSCGNSTGNNDLFMVDFSPSSSQSVGNKISNFKIIEAEFSNQSDNPNSPCAFNHYIAYTGDGIVKGVKGKITNCCGDPSKSKNILLTLNPAATICPVALFPNGCLAPTPSGVGCFPTTFNVGSEYEQCLATKGAFKVSACKSCTNPLDGISTLDLVLISKHILGTQPITDNCKKYAADVNENGTITTADIVELRKLILGVIQFFSTNPGCYRFIEEKSSDCMANVNLINDDVTKKFDANFKIIKKGDVNCSALGLNTPPKNEITITKEVNISTALTNDMVHYDFKPSSFSNIEGFQMGIRYDATQLEFIGQTALDLPLANEYNIANSIENGGALNLVWTNQNTVPYTLSQGQKIFRLTFRAKQAISNTLSLLNLDNSILSNEIYCATYNAGTVSAGEIETKAIVLTPLGNIIGNGNAAKMGNSSQQSVGMNIKTIPNPFDKELSLQVDAEVNMPVTIEVYDMLGRMVAQHKITFVKGSNTVEFRDISQWSKGNYTIKIQNEITKEQFFSKVQKI
jgi:hypothetical protein